MHLEQCLAPKTLPGLKGVHKSLGKAALGSAVVSAGETAVPTDRLRMATAPPLLPDTPWDWHPVRMEFTPSPGDHRDTQGVIKPLYNLEHHSK